MSNKYSDKMNKTEKNEGDVSIENFTCHKNFLDRQTFRAHRNRTDDNFVLHSRHQMIDD